VLQGLKVSVLEGEEGARCFLSFISGTNTNKETKIDNTRESLAFSKDSEAVIELGDTVSSLNFISVGRLLALKWNEGIELSSSEGGCAAIDDVENFVEYSGISAACDSETFHLE